MAPRRYRVWLDDDYYDYEPPGVTATEIIEDDFETFTGLYTEFGEPIFYIKLPIGFIHEY